MKKNEINAKDKIKNIFAKLRIFMPNSKDKKENIPNIKL